MIGWRWGRVHPASPPPLALDCHLGGGGDEGAKTQAQGWLFCIERTIRLTRWQGQALFPPLAAGAGKSHEPVP